MIDHEKVAKELATGIHTVMKHFGAENYAYFGAENYATQAGKAFQEVLDQVYNEALEDVHKVDMLSVACTWCKARPSRMCWDPPANAPLHSVHTTRLDDVIESLKIKVEG